MAIVTGYLAQFGITLMPYAPLLEFVPSGPAITGSNYIVVPKSIVATLTPSGDFTVDLLPNTETRPDTHYRLRVTWLNGEGVPVGREDPDWQIIVPPGGGPIGPMIGASIQSTQVWSTTPGVIPPAAKSGDWIFNYVENHLGRIA